MAKPIVFITLPNVTQARLHETAQYLKMSTIGTEYHILCVNDPEGEKVEMKVFYEKDHLEIDIEGLQKLIVDVSTRKESEVLRDQAS